MKAYLQVHRRWNNTRSGYWVVHDK